jgi:glucokinase
MPDPLLLGLEIGGTKLQLGLGNGDGRLLAMERRTVDPGAGRQGILNQIESAIDPLLGHVGAHHDRIAAAGIGFGGPVDARRGIVLQSHQIRGWEGFPLAEWARDHLGIRRVVLENDADTAGLGEARIGAGAGLTPVLYVTIGSGVGGGLIVDGEIYRGSGTGAMEIGHLRIGESGADDVPETLEAIASGWSIGNTARTTVEAHGLDHPEIQPLLRLASGVPAQIEAETVAKAVAQGDAFARALLHRATDAMGRALALAVTLLAPRRIILGGGVSLSRDQDWLIPISKTLDRHVFPPLRGTFDVCTASLGEQVVVHGALCLAANACTQ